MTSFPRIRAVSSASFETVDPAAMTPGVRRRETLSSPFELEMPERPFSAPTIMGGMMPNVHESGLLPAITEIQLEKLRPPPKTSRFGLSKYPASSLEELEMYSRLVLDAFTRAENSLKAGKFSSDKTYRHIYRPDRSYTVNAHGFAAAKSFTLKTFAYVLREHSGHLTLVIPRRRRFEESGSLKTATGMWLLPLTRFGDLTECVLLRQPKVLLEDHGKRVPLPPIREEYMLVEDLTTPLGPLYAPEHFFSGILPDAETEELTEHSCAVQTQLPFLVSNRPSNIVDRILALSGAAEGLTLLHDNNIVHRDVRLDNMIGFSKKRKIHGGLVDFGEAKRFGRRNPLTGTFEQTSSPIGHLSMEAHAPEVQLLFYRLKARIEGTPMDPSLVRKYITGNDDKPAEVPKVVVDNMVGTIRSMERFCRLGTPEERIQKIRFPFGPKQDIWMLGRASRELIGDFITPPSDPAADDRYKDLRELLDLMQHPNPDERPSAKEVVSAFKPFLPAVEAAAEPVVSSAAGGAAAAAAASACTFEGDEAVSEETILASQPAPGTEPASGAGRG